MHLARCTKVDGLDMGVNMHGQAPHASAIARVYPSLKGKSFPLIASVKAVMCALSHVALSGHTCSRWHISAFSAHHTALSKPSSQPCAIDTHLTMYKYVVLALQNVSSMRREQPHSDMPCRNGPCCSKQNSRQAAALLTAVCCQRFHTKFL